MQTCICNNFVIKILDQLRSNDLYYNDYKVYKSNNFHSLYVYMKFSGIIWHNILIHSEGWHRFVRAVMRFSANYMTQHIS